jgi:restriction system protein
MAVPQFFWFIDPILRVLREDEEPVHRRDLRARVPKLMNLTEEDMRELAGEKGKQRGITKVADRIGWATSRAGRMGWAVAASRGYWRITDAGIKLLDEHPDGIPELVHREAQSQIRQWRRERNEDKKLKGKGDPIGNGGNKGAEGDAPDERIAAAYGELREAVADALLEQVRAADPAFFELLVLRLLNAVGYGADDSSLEPTGGTGDGGIDGVISLDRLGLERVYVQAKRYADGNTVGRPAIQAFLGAITMKNASKGVFITSSAFSREARDYVIERDGIVLIDGDELAELMMDYGVGTRRTESLHLIEVDEAFFEDGH